MRNSKLIGESPDTGSVYGYSAWENANGIVSVRNPANKKQSFSFVLDRIIGVVEGAENMTCVTVLPYTEKPDERKYSYGDTVSVDLEPHEIRIFKFTNENTAPLKLTEAKFIDEKRSRNQKKASARSRRRGNVAVMESGQWWCG